MARGMFKWIFKICIKDSWPGIPLFWVWRQQDKPEINDRPAYW